MAELILTIFVFVAVVAIAAVLFGIWVVYKSVVGVLRGVGRWVDPASRSDGAVGSSLGASSCFNPGCLSPNPSGARYCRRCGRALFEVKPVQVRRVAMW